MKERTAEEVFICLTLRWLAPVRDRGRGLRGRGGGVEEKGSKEGRRERECGEQAHLYVWLPSAKRSAAPGLINSEKRSQSFFFRLTPAHMAWQWLSHHLRRNREAVTAPYSDPTCFAAAIRLGNRREKRERKRRKRSLRHSSYALGSPPIPSPSLYLMTRSCSVSLWHFCEDEVTAALFDLPCSNPPFKVSLSARKLNSGELCNQNVAQCWIKALLRRAWHKKSGTELLVESWHLKHFHLSQCKCQTAPPAFSIKFHHKRTRWWWNSLNVSSGDQLSEDSALTNPWQTNTC